MDLTREQRFEELLSVVYAPLQRFIRRRTADGDDVLADVLVVLWRRLEEIPAEAVLPWSYGVARGCLLNARRSDDRRWRLLRRLADEPDPPPPAEDPELAAALATLTPGDQEVLRMWAWEQLPAREIAIVLGITPNAASIRLHRATIKLRTALIGVTVVSRAGTPRAGIPSAVPVLRKSRAVPGQEPDRQEEEATR